MVEPDSTHIAQILLPEELSVCVFVFVFVCVCVYVYVCVTLSRNQNSVGYFQPFKKWSFRSLGFVNKKLFSDSNLIKSRFLFFGF